MAELVLFSTREHSAKNTVAWKERRFGHQPSETKNGKQKTALSMFGVDYLERMTVEHAGTESFAYVYTFCERDLIDTVRRIASPFISFAVLLAIRVQWKPRLTGLFSDRSEAWYTI